jgi:hypothetical protein
VSNSHQTPECKEVLGPWEEREGRRGGFVKCSVVCVWGKEYRNLVVVGKQRNMDTIGEGK